MHDEIASRAEPKERWGLFTLANDAVVEWLLALLESVRQFAPDLPLLVIPYDDRQKRLASIVADYGHRFLESDAIERFHAIGRRFYPDDEFAARGFRKLAAFHGPFDRFFVLDSDTVLLAPLLELQAAIESDRVDLVHFDTDIEQVLRPGPLRDALRARGRGRGFNAGLFAGARGALTAERFAAALEDLGPAWHDLLVPNAEQPFLNLAADRLELKIAGAHELVRDVCSTAWPAVGRLEYDGSSFRLRDSGRWDEGWRFLCAHWAGYGVNESFPNREVWRRFRERSRF